MDAESRQIEDGSTAQKKSGRTPKLLDRLRDAMRVRHYSRRTEEAYTYVTRRFIIFHHVHHPAEMGRVEISQFLTHLAVKERVSASTQNQALNALLFLYGKVLGVEIALIVLAGGMTLVMWGSSAYVLVNAHGITTRAVGEVWAVQQRAAPAGPL